MKVKKMNWFVKILTFGWASAITLAPFGIYIREKYLDDEFMINHEKIHWRQQLEMLVIFFYLWYLIEWIIRIFINKGLAYRMICFEQEAYKNDYNLYYLDYRKKFTWFKYIHK